jgi:hypothetical protein
MGGVLDSLGPLFVNNRMVKDMTVEVMRNGPLDPVPTLIAIDGYVYARVSRRSSRPRPTGISSVVLDLAPL